MLYLLLVHRFEHAGVDLLLSLRYHFEQFLLSPIPLYFGPLPLVYLLPIALQLLLTHRYFLIQLSFFVLLLFKFPLERLVLGFEFFAFFDNAVDSLANSFHLFLKTVGFFFFCDGVVELSF